MPWRLISIIIICGVLLGFIGLNLTNTCDLSLGFKVFTGVPVYLTVFISFILGMISSLPFFILGSLKKILKKEKKQKAENLPDMAISALPSSPKKSGGLFRKKPSSSSAEKTEDSGSYGID